MKKEVLRLEAIASEEHGQTTLNGLGMSLYEGEVLGVFSNYLAVKNDVVRIIAGQKGPTAGRIYLDNEPCPFEEVNERRLRRVGVVRSTKTLIDDFSVAENIFVVRRGLKTQIIDKRVLDEQTRLLMEEFGFDLAPESRVRDIPEARRCGLEIVKAIALGARVLILQDLSTFLSDFEIAQLFEFIARLKHKELGFVLVDSSSAYLQMYAERIVVIRDGRSFWGWRGKPEGSLTDACFSEHRRAFTLDAKQAGTQPCLKTDAVLTFEGVQTESLNAVCFSLHEGEGLCIVDQGGKGIDDIKALLSGQLSARSGRIFVSGEVFRGGSVQRALDQRVAFVMENPTDSMLFPDFTALDNLCFPSSRKTRDFWINPRYKESCKREYAKFFAPGALEKYPDELSIQDLHKLVYCRWHLYNPKVVVCVKPFNSVEKSLEEISAFFIELLREKGIAVLILTSNASESNQRWREIRVNPVFR